ncbi:tetratricopeptide repeat protein [Streptomyces sp. NPDC087270]|uniref:tetratricopeptide repeat protein n=1 Tax=Streptomyces sp. NPDC087270 TaxID=3365774 RepID=UPI003800404D
MEFDRRVQIRVHRETGTTFGSGYLVAPRLALTAGHVVQAAMGPEPARVTVCRPDAGTEQFPAAVRWWRVDDRVDAALVEVDGQVEVDGAGGGDGQAEVTGFDGGAGPGEGAGPGGGAGRRWQPPDSLADIRTRPPQRWGRIIGTRPHPVAVAGFPRMEKDPSSGDRFDGRISGEIMPGTGSLAGRYEVFSKDATIPVRDGTGTGWSGMSGAALLTESRQSGLLCGVVRADRQAVGGTRLTATPASLLLADDGFTALIAEHGGWQPLLEAAEPVDLLDPAAPERDLRSPAMLLRADAEAVAFRGRADELRALRDWCQVGAEGFSVRVVTGPGGQGKSRLARQLADDLRAEGWVTGHIRAELRDSDLALPELRSLETALDFLLVIDYADARPSLVRRVIDQLRGCRHRTRLLLLARTGGAWQSDGLTASYADEILARAPTIELAALVGAGGPPDAMTALFRGAVGDLADLLEALPGLPGRPPAGWTALAPALGVPSRLGVDGDESVLTVQMAALTALLQHGSAPVSAAPEEPAEATLLRHEQRYWVRAAERLGPLDPTVLQQAVAVAALCGARDEPEAVAAVGALPGIPPARAPVMAAWLRTLYPAGPDRFWGPLQPDRVGEYHASRALLDLDPPLPLADLLARSSADQQVRLVTVLARAAAAHHGTGRTARTAGVQQALLDAMPAGGLSVEVLNRLRIVLIHAHDGLDRLALKLAEDSVTAARRQAADGSATALNDLGIALDLLSSTFSGAGRAEEALAAAAEQLRVIERLDRNHPGRDRAYALAVSTLSSCLSAAGRDQEALLALGESVELLERLGETDRHTRTRLAWNLNNLADGLWDLGRLDEARRALRRAVELSEQLAATDSSHEILLPVWRSNLAALLVGMRRHQEGLRYAEDAVQGLRLLARRDPRNFEGRLISSLVNLGNILHQLGRSAEACDALRQAVGIGEHRRRIGLAGAEAELSLVKHTLQLGLWQALSGSLETLPDALCRALDLWYGLDRELPKYQPLIASFLTDSVALLSEDGRWQEALEPSMAAVEIWGGLVRAYPADHLRDFVEAYTAMQEVARRVGSQQIPRNAAVAMLSRHLEEQLPYVFEVLDEAEEAAKAAEAAAHRE